MKIKNVVKVINFQSLVRVDNAKKKADKYRNVGKEITDILARIFYNKNLILDKKVLVPLESLPVLNIYIANDYGFCGNFNAEINNELISEFQKVLKKLDEISSREKLLIDLVKQLYSDLEIVNLTNPNRNDALKEFFKKRIIGEDD